MAQANPFFVRCIKPNNDKCPMKFDMPVVLEQLRYTGMLETIRMRKLGYPVRKKYAGFAGRYRCLLTAASGRPLPRGLPTKEVARLVLEQEGGPASRDSFQLGSTKVFMKEALEQRLEKRRLDLFTVAVVKLQRHARGYIARRRYQTMLRSVLLIQRTYRGWRVRREYQTVRTGIVKLQATFKMKRQRSRYGEMRETLIQRAEVERRSRELAVQRAARNNTARDESGGGGVGLEKQQQQQLRAVAGVNHLEIPAELAFVFSKLDSWTPVNSEKNLAKVSGRMPPAKTALRLPSDIDYYVFSKVASLYFKSHLWQMRKEPIKTPFLSKAKESDYQESLAIFKLILRFMNDTSLSGLKEKILGDYIINKGIRNEKLRDEIFCQLANQTWKNDNEANCERGWLLMANCLSAFGPSRTLYKYLVKYVSDHAVDGYKYVCQSKLLRAGQLAELHNNHHASRQFPPTVLEWRANKKRVNMALEVTCHDGETSHVPVESMTTAEAFAAQVLRSRGGGSGLAPDECHGWTVAMEDGTSDELVELNGDDFVLDLIGELELPPAFPATAGVPFLVCQDRSRGGQVPLTVDTGRGGGDQYRHSSSPRGLGAGSKAHQRQQRSKSQVGPALAAFLIPVKVK
jgi:myosin-15